MRVLVNVAVLGLVPIPRMHVTCAPVRGCRPQSPRTEDLVPSRLVCFLGDKSHWPEDELGDEVWDYERRRIV